MDCPLLYRSILHISWRMSYTFCTFSASVRCQVLRKRMTLCNLDNHVYWLKQPRHFCSDIWVCSVSCDGHSVDLQFSCSMRQRLGHEVNEWLAAHSVQHSYRYGEMNGVMTSPLWWWVGAGCCWSSNSPGRYMHQCVLALVGTCTSVYWPW